MNLNHSSLIPFSGIASLELLLSEDPPLGTWIIKAIYRDNKEYSNTFDVKEYGNTYRFYLILIIN